MDFFIQNLRERLRCMGMWLVDLFDEIYYVYIIIIFPNRGSRKGYKIIVFEIKIWVKSLRCTWFFSFLFIKLVLVKSYKTICTWTRHWQIHCPLNLKLKCKHVHIINKWVKGWRKCRSWNYTCSILLEVYGYTKWAISTLGCLVSNFAKFS